MGTEVETRAEEFYHAARDMLAAMGWTDAQVERVASHLADFATEMARQEEKLLTRVQCMFLDMAVPPEELDGAARVAVGGVFFSASKATLDKV